IAVSNRFSVEAVNEIYEGIYLACEKYGVDLVGGDTVSSLTGLVLSGTAIGEVTPDKFVLRSTAKKGDLLCVTGDLGAAYLGLQLLEREKKIYNENPELRPELENKTYVLQRFLKPEARRDIIDFFAENGIQPTSMMDISDGLSSEALHICKQSGTGCIIYEEKIPVHPQAFDTALEFKMDPVTCALHGGEDYELLFTISPKDHDKITLSEQISVIGYLTHVDEGCQLMTKNGNKHALTAQGWNAFKER
ncbi:MAG: thiamine-phosphate kinase, partial [Chitinophagaceae bacterium]